MIPYWRRFLLLCVLGGAALSPVWAQQEASRPGDAFGSAVELYQQQLYPDAAAAFSAFRRGHPTHAAAPQALYLEAQAALARGDDEGTRRLLNRLQHDYPSHPRAQTARLRLAQYYLDQGSSDRATSQLQTIATAPNRPGEGARALYLLGRTEQDQGNPNAALPYFKQVYSRYPDAELAPAALYAQGVTQVRLERYDRATDSFERLGEQFPTSPFAENLGTVLGEVYYRLGQYENATTELQRRLPDLTGSDRARTLFLLGETYSALGRGEDATTQYRVILEEAPDSPYALPARYGLARQHYSAGRYEAAAEAFATVRSKEDPLAVKATYYEAASRALMGRKADALKLYRTFLDRTSGGRLATAAQYEVGLLHYREERYDRAATAFRSVAQQASSEGPRGKAFYWLGNASLATNRLDPALDAYTEAIDRGAAPAAVTAKVRFRKAWSLYQGGRYADAGSEFQALAEAHPETTRGQEALFWGGDTFYQQNQFGEARRLFQQYLDTNPDTPQRAGAQYALAWTHFKQRRFGPAAQSFRRFLDTYEGDSTSEVPYQQDARLRLADCYFALKQYDDARAAYDRVSGKGTEYALYQGGRALYYAGRPADALDRLRRFVEDSPDSPLRPDALYRIGDIHFQEQRYGAARAAFTQLLDEHPEHARAAEAQYAIGDTRYNAGEMERAVEAYRTVLEAYPESPSAREAASSLFFALNAAGQQDRADDLIAAIADQVPDANLEDRLRYQRARAAYQRGDSKRALRLFRTFVRTASTQALIPDAYYYLGLLYADTDRYDEAKNYLQQLVEQYPDSEYIPEGSLRLGEIHLDQGAHEQAVDAYRTAAEHNQTRDDLRAQARYGQSQALLRLGRTSAADTLLSQTLDAKPQGPLQNAARLGLGRVRNEQGRTDEALALYRRVVRASDGEPGAEALYRLGKLLRRQGDAQTAIRELERMPSLFAGHPEWEARALLEQARAYRDRGETGRAVQLYDEVQKAYGGTPFAQTAQDEQQAIES
ncbi:tetratricopeptide repeat protein [Salinibacter altiplanensis]|uniref:tetratricopeptide repeat protein n=1 Tax=Salinibacter altiplanensis TaxID=1803181 RepID=UPI001E3F609C|nr:tetratricopeptide repeat protein [Salinibacter altiplanensis]